MTEYPHSEYGPTILRIMLGLLFLIPGIMKLTSPAMIIKMLADLGFPAPGAFGWLLLLSEIIFGTSVLIGWRVKLTVWPLAVVLLVAAATVYVPKLATDPMALITIMFHLLGIAGLISISLTGPGALAVEK